MELLRFITLFIGLVFFPALTSARCNFKKYAQKNSGNTTALQACISTMKPSRVDNSHCGGVNWYLSQSLWQHTESCYSLCASCLYTGISAGASEVSCRQHKIFAHCHVGYF
ncbi:hypothetical protein PCANC_01458 [Puccinia coronata f. sp. avenae]|uniref:Uncharacterized protein n=1 Tax=Puccinia coronata f. sp. avenae TaxID=200324 RepID=A0A2N5S0B7_9BASI|nr:hypothetical protein PCASD_21814 [Puccinia coronata f. sp. avenae]PLW18249.1 hypothetical protein PCANC_10381 [Puccinia coronata f. sp. avenae]PLW51675.1 hypothetical protein PCASD_00483 [Puccinia coronata f. sp. avenae]PLW56617.1 hypothetical protein PCANC_01458 [Puccinia coronata f. sp. avenae]